MSTALKVSAALAQGARMHASAAYRLPALHYARSARFTAPRVATAMKASNARGFAMVPPGGYRRERPPVNLGFVIVPQQKTYIVERLGRFHAVLDSGFHFLIPFLDRIAYVHSLKEETITIPNQTAITRDNVVLQIDGVLYLRIVDPKAASYGIADAVYALSQLAQTTMRSELGKITLDEAFRERDNLNHGIVQAINAAASTWGTEVLRYEIKDITPPSAVRTAMEMQAEAERRKRAEILESEGRREASINNAEGQRQSAILAAQGDADALLNRARAAASAIEMLGSAIKKNGGKEAVSMRLAEQYVSAFSKLAKNGTTVIVPAQVAEPSTMVSQALAMWSAMNKAPHSRSSSTEEDVDSPEEKDSLLGAVASTDLSSGIAEALSATRNTAQQVAADAKTFVPKPIDAPAASNEGFKPKPF